MLLWPHLEYCVDLGASIYQKDVKVPESVQRRATKLVKGMSHEERLRTLLLSSLEEGRLRGILLALHNFLRRGGGNRGASLFSLVGKDRAQQNGTKLHQGTRQQEKFLHHEGKAALVLLLPERMSLGLLCNP